MPLHCLRLLQTSPLHLLAYLFSTTLFAQVKNGEAILMLLLLLLRLIYSCCHRRHACGFCAFLCTHPLLFPSPPSEPGAENFKPREHGGMLVLLRSLLSKCFNVRTNGSHAAPACAFCTHALITHMLFFFP
ncbi:hypothetical protein C7974DRAFT_375103 [Boeremia exigua]|uniref:uncharacterized protein n=1 Tax=Boeremia exigua TaxID=749465 RepID=UPI001E8D8F35|nr:uncharacterized protein C7974DRAFT_375103 [Boeremia exigua]KAH6632949.1 hypothetical protein C7974DRAFT_375103 [Boeremia exigua]